MTGCGETCVVYDASLTGYDFGPAHPMNPVRVDLTMQLSGALGILERPGGLRAVAAPDATDEDLLLVHDPALIEAVRQIGRAHV